MRIIEKIKRLPNKFKRRFLQFSVLKIISQLIHRKELEKSIKYLPKIYL
jgi:hypothetical protein